MALDGVMSSDELALTLMLEDVNERIAEDEESPFDSEDLSDRRAAYLLFKQEVEAALEVHQGRPTASSSRVGRDQPLPPVGNGISRADTPVGELTRSDDETEGRSIASSSRVDRDQSVSPVDDSIASEDTPVGDLTPSDEETEDSDSDEDWDATESDAPALRLQAIQAQLDHLQTLIDAAEASEASASASTSQSRSPSPINPPATDPLVECTACTENHPTSSAFRNPCAHSFCTPCTIALFSHATKDETLFPPRCCTQPIDVPSAKRFLPPDLATLYDAKAIEYRTHPRVYCARASCAAFIPPQYVTADAAHCVKCHTRTCTTCNEEAHVNDCPKDPAVQMLMRVAEREGWRQCRECRRVVELIEGCYHITCHCSHQFCYLCGEKWKGCGCPQFSELRILDRGQRIDD